jgi:hypothetical protein
LQKPESLKNELACLFELQVADVTSKVAIVKFDVDVQESFERALKLIGNIDDLNTKKRPVVIKVGVFNHKAETHSTVNVVDAIVNNFNHAPTNFPC